MRTEGFLLWSELYVWGHISIRPAPDVNYFCGQGEAESFPSFENMKGKEGQDLSGWKGPQEVSGKNLLLKAGLDQITQGFSQRRLGRFLG